MKHTIEIEIPDGSIATAHLVVVQYTSVDMMDSNESAMSLEFEGGLYNAIGLAVRAGDFLRGIS